MLKKILPALLLGVSVAIIFLLSAKISHSKAGGGVGKNLKIKIIKKGSSEKKAKKGDVLTVHYTGYLKNGVKFDSSLDRKKPFKFTLGKGRVIKGWDLGLNGAEIGEKRKLTVPPDLAYGSKGIPPKIPPNSTLIFEIEVLNIE